MSIEGIEPYITHLPIFKVVTCNFCEISVSPNDPLRHYEDHHTANKEHPVPMTIRHQIADYMATLELCQPKTVVSPHTFVPELKVHQGFVCNFPDCGACASSEPSMRQHYRKHQKSIPKNFKNWEPTSFQTFFDGSNKKYTKTFQMLMIDISQ